MEIGGETAGGRARVCTSSGMGVLTGNAQFPIGARAGGLKACPADRAPRKLKPRHATAARRSSEWRRLCYCHMCVVIFLILSDLVDTD